MNNYGFEPYLSFYPSPEFSESTQFSDSTFYSSSISDHQQDFVNFQPEYQYTSTDYAMFYNTPTMLDSYTFVPDFIPDHMMLLQKSYSEPSRELKRVVQTTNINDDIHSCLWVNCHIKAPTLEKLMQHICEQHIGSGKAIYFCEWKDCPRNKKPFMKRHKMHNHMRTHTGERPFICNVLGCNKTFSRPDSLSTHIKTHSDIRPYLCSVPGCEKAYFHSRSLRKHVKSCHLNTPSSSVRRNTPSKPSAAQP